MSETSSSEGALVEQAMDVVDYWLMAGPQRWFRKDAAFDADFRERFLAAHEAAAAGKLSGLAATARGAMALVLLLDQLPRNGFRGSPRMFATDAQARAIAEAAIEAGFDREVPEDLRNFFYLPFMHSESLADQDKAVALCAQLGQPETDKYARMHRDIIVRFGRFPHRNAVLGRQSTEEELAFLASGGFGG
ncbi:MAG: DUF924 family protein [Myxococcota bacterium]